MKPTLSAAVWLLLSLPLLAAEVGWKLHPDAEEKPDVPRGSVEKIEAWESQVFPGTTRDWWIYLPSGLDPAKPAALMVFQDGHDYVNPKGHWRVPTVLDNLIARAEMPPTVAVFLNPGHAKERGKESPGETGREGAAKPAWSPWKSSNRSLEYDSLGDRYARMLLEEILPEVGKRCTLSRDPEMRAIGGASSGASCAFTVAWEHPEAFRKVFSSIGSFVNLRGANAYPSLIRKTEPKPIRVFLADSSGDLDNPYGNWPLANKQMHAALQYMGYDVRFEYAEGYGHNSDHAGSLFPDALRWLWRKEKHQPVINTRGDGRGDMTLLRLLIPGEGWEVAQEGLGMADGLCADSEGNLYFCDMKAPAVYRLGVDGQRRLIAAESVSGLRLGPDGLLYACQGSKKRVISIDPARGEVREVASNLSPNDLVVSAEGRIYLTETGSQRVICVDSKTGETFVADEGVAGPNGIALSPDGGTLAVSEYKGGFVWAYRLEADGKLSGKAPYMTLRLPVDPKGEFRFHEPPPFLTAAKGDGMATDRAGRYYVTSALGVQIFDPTGRMCGVLERPNSNRPVTSCALAGRGLDTLYVANGDRLWRRKLTVESPR
ncbi:MAG: Gluconolactonase precursor [Verrucomicrobiota bacterium]